MDIYAIDVHLIAKKINLVFLCELKEQNKMSEKEIQRVMLTKRLLKESLLQLMKTKNVQAISVKELCDDSGINRSTFYNHYGRPIDVLEEMENDIIAGVPVVSLNNITENGNDKEAFIKQAASIFQYVQDNHDFALLLLLNGDSNSDFAMKAFNFPAIKSSIEGFIPDKYDAIEKNLILKFIQSGFYSMVREWVIDDGHKTVQDMAELMADMIDIVFTWRK